MSREKTLSVIALSIGRAKGHIRVLLFIQENAVGPEMLRAILHQHELLSNWEQFENK